MAKKYWIILITLVLVGIAYIAYPPEPCGYTLLSFVAIHRDCTCLGVKYSYSCENDTKGMCPDFGDGVSAGTGTSCVGIVTKDQCYEFGNPEGSWDGKISNIEWKEISCSEL